MNGRRIDRGTRIGSVSDDHYSHIVNAGIVDESTTVRRGGLKNEKPSDVIYGRTLS